MSEVHKTAIIEDGAELGVGVKVGPFCTVGPHVRIGVGTELISHVVLSGHTTIGADCRIFPFAAIGTDPQDLKYNGELSFVEIGDRNVFRESVTVNLATNGGEVTRIGDDCLFMACTHVAHSCQVGNGVIMANYAGLAGDVVVEDLAIIGGMTAVHQFCRVGTMCIVGGCSRIDQDCLPYMLVVGNPASTRGPNSVGLRRRGLESETRRIIKDAYKSIFRRGLSTTQAVEKLSAQYPGVPEVELILKYIAGSERGITK